MSLTRKLGLGSILLASEALLREAPESEPWRRDFEVIHRAALRCKKIVVSLLEFCRKKDFQFQTVSIHKIVKESLRLCREKLKLSRISVALSYKRGLPEVVASPAHMEQVFINLILNALDAMPSGGRLTIYAGGQGESQVQVSFTDTGQGIPGDHLARIFEPFFTTKEVGKGTGLGLAICHNIVERHRGRIQATSPGSGRGATFTVTLPTRSLGGPL